MQDAVRQTKNEVERTSQALVVAAKNLLSKGNPQEGFFLLVDADNLTPNDRTIRKLMSDAQQLVNRMQGIANPLSNDPKYLGYMAQGRAAMAANNPIAAVECFENALRQTNSRDSFALRALMDARSAKDRLGQRATDYEKALKQGIAMMNRKEYGPAAFMLEGAVRLFPEQKTADLLEEAKFQDLVARSKNLLERDPDGAEKLADQALRMRPADIGANNLIKQAKARAIALANPKANPVDPYESAMAVGRAAMREKKYGEAVQAFKLALDNKPSDPIAMELEKQARANLVGIDPNEDKAGPPKTEAPMGEMGK
jgi:tetratricopeptide (TPR) repeat protein